MSHYENPEVWKAERYTESEEEVGRLTATAALVPAAAGSLLDVGAGNGAFLRRLEGRSLRLAGLEPSRSALSLNLSRAPMVRGSIVSLPFPDRAFDVVSSLEVIEHLPVAAYARALAELERVAATGLLISVPYREIRIAATCPSCGCRFDPHYHMRTFDDAALASLFRTFRLRERVLIPVFDVPFGALLRRVYKLVGGERRRFPATAVCPQCGFHRPAPPPSDGPPRPGLGAKLKRFRRTYWVTAYYARG